MTNAVGDLATIHARAKPAPTEMCLPGSWVRVVGAMAQKIKLKIRSSGRSARQMLHRRGPPAPSSDEIQFDQNDADKKEILRQMEVGMADCSDRLVRGLLRQGERSKSRIASYTATTCGQGLKRFLVMHDVPAGAADKYAERIAWKALQNVLQ